MYASIAAHAPARLKRNAVTNVLSIVDVAFLLCFASSSPAIMRAQMPDDAFIYLRMAQNVVTRNEWAFNPGVPVNAATSPLYELFVSFLTSLHLPGLTTPLVLASAIGLSTLAYAVYRGTIDYGRRAALLCALLSISFPTILRSEGLETPLYLALVALTALFVQDGNEFTIGIAAGLTAISRPEGGLIIVLALGTQWWRSRRLPWRGVILAVVPVILWLLFCQHAFHHLVPHTMKIKAMQSTVRFWHGSWLLAFVKQLKAMILLLPFSVAGCYIAAKSFRERPFIGLVLAFGVVQTIGYTVLHAPAMYFWYDAPGDLAYILTVTLGGLSAIRWVSRRISTRPRELSANVVLGLALLYVIICAFWQKLHSQPYRVSPDYIAAADWLHTHAQQGDWVAADEIGYLGVYSGLQIRDMLGLADSQSVEAIQQRRWDFWFTDSAKPRYIVLHSPQWVGEPGFVDTPWSAAALKDYTTAYRPAFEVGAVRVMELR